MLSVLLLQHAVCLDTKATGIGLAIYTLVIACFSGFLGPIIVGALVHSMGSFSQAMVANGTFLIGAGLLMTGLGLWERRRAHRGASSHDEDHAVVAVDSGEQSMISGDAGQDTVRTRQKDIELAG